MFFNPNEWVLNSTKDMMFNVKTFRTIRRRTWHDNSANDASGDFTFFSFHELNASQAVAFLFSSVEDAKAAHPQSVENRFNFDMVDYQMWRELYVDFQNGFEIDRSTEYPSYSEYDKQ